MVFDWHINLGELIAAGGVITTVFIMHRQNVERVKGIETKLDIIFDWFRSTIIGGKGGDPKE